MLRSPSAYCDSLHSTAYTRRLFPDVVLRAFSKAYPAHRVILASQSAYFATLWSWISWQPAVGRNKGVDEEWPTIPSHDLVLGEDVTQRGFEWILEYFYASPHVSVTSDNAFDVLAAAHYLGVTAVQTACAEFLAQHLDPHNFAACLQWATRADHGEASDMLATSCCRLLALRLPQNLAAWAPALLHIEPWTLLDIMSSDHLAVPTEYERYKLVKNVAKICGAAAAEAAAAVTKDSRSAASGGSPDGDSGEVAIGSTPIPGTLEVQRMLSSALRLSDEGLGGHLELSRPCSSAAQTSDSVSSATRPNSTVSCALGCLHQSSSASLSSVAAGLGDADSDASLVGSASPAASGIGMSSSECTAADGTSVLMSSQASSRSTFRLDEVGGGRTGAERVTDEITIVASGVNSDVCDVAAASLPSVKTRGSSDRAEGADAPRGLGSPVAAGSATAVAATAAAQLLLHEAVRYEHLTVPQLMVVEQEGLVSANVLHAALWERTRLDCEVHYRGNRVAATSSQADAEQPLVGVVNSDTERGRVLNPAAGVRAGVQVMQPRFRAFRICWRLTCGSLQKLQSKALLQSELHQYAGALWQLRLCCSERPRSHLGLFVGRHLAGAAAVGSRSALWAPRHGARVSPARQEELGQEAAAHGPQRMLRGRRVHRQPLLEPLFERRDPAPPPYQQALALVQPPEQFFAYTDQKSSLRARCRLSVFQSDNTALQGQLSLGDTGDFTVDFAAGGFFGQSQLISRADLARLAEEQEVLVCMSLQVLTDEV